MTLWTLCKFPKLKVFMIWPKIGLLNKCKQKQKINQRNFLFIVMNIVSILKIMSIFDWQILDGLFLFYLSFSLNSISLNFGNCKNYFKFFPGCKRYRHGKEVLEMGDGTRNILSQFLVCNNWIPSLAGKFVYISEENRIFFR